MSQVSTKLAQIRKKHRVNQNELAEAMGISESMLAMIEGGKRNLNVGQLELAAEYLGEDIAVFFGKISPVPRQLHAKELEDQISQCPDLAPNIRKVFADALHRAALEDRRERRSLGSKDKTSGSRGKDSRGNQKT